MLEVSIKLAISVATGMIGGYVHHTLGVQWGLPMLAGLAIGFLLGGRLH